MVSKWPSRFSFSRPIHLVYRILYFQWYGLGLVFSFFVLDVCALFEIEVTSLILRLIILLWNLKKDLINVYLIFILSVVLAWPPLFCPPWFVIELCKSCINFTVTSIRGAVFF